MDQVRPVVSSRFLDRIVTVIRDLVFGVEDSLVSTLGVITGIAGGTENRFAVVLAGVVVIIVEALSMAAGSYLSAKSEREVQARRLATEQTAISEHPGAEEAKLATVYRQRGFNDEEIRVLLKRAEAKRSILLEELAVHKLGIPLGAATPTPTRNAFAMGISYLVAGVIPIAPYLIVDVTAAIPVSVGLTVVTLFFVGFAEGSLAGRRRFRSGLQMAVVSMVAAGAGFLVGKLVAQLFGVTVN